MSATADQPAGRPAARSRLRRLRRRRRGAEKALVPVLLVVVAILLPFFFDSGGSVHAATATLALAYVVMALGLNIIVGFAGLLDLGYVAFFAIGAYTMGWFGSRLLLRGQPRQGHPHPRQRVRGERCRASTSTSCWSCRSR